MMDSLATEKFSNEFQLSGTSKLHREKITWDGATYLMIEVYSKNQSAAQFGSCHFPTLLAPWEKLSIKMLDNKHRRLSHHDGLEPMGRTLARATKSTRYAAFLNRRQSQS